jgi:predicted DNA-binding WGR domain protein
VFRTRAFPLLAILVGMTTPCFGARPSAASVHELLTASGLRHEIERVSQFLVDNPDSLLKLEETVAKGDYRSVAVSVFAPAKLVSAVEGKVASRLDQASAEAAIRWWSSPLGRKFAAADSKADSAEGAAELEKFSHSLAAASPAPDRDELVRQFDRASDGAGFSVKLFSSCAAAAATAPELTNGKKRSASEVEALRDQTASNMRSGAESDQHLEALYAYSAFSDSDLREYVAFLSSEAGARVRNATESAVVEAFVKACGALGSGLGGKLAAQPAAAGL